MKIYSLLTTALLACVALLMGTSCSDGKTYAQLLDDENHYVNAFLADQRVINYVPEDTVFEYGPDAPYYRLDEDGQLYMQVIDPGTPGNKAEYNELLYFRFTRYPMSTYNDGEFASADGNDDALGGNLSFRYGNYELNSSYSYGVGIQAPLQYVPIDAKVNIVIKSQYGMPSEMANVIPWLYSIRYFRPKI